MYIIIQLFNILIFASIIIILLINTTKTSPPPILTSPQNVSFSSPNFLINKNKINNAKIPQKVISIKQLNIKNLQKTKSAIEPNFENNSSKEIIKSSSNIEKFNKEKEELIKQKINTKNEISNDGYDSDEWEPYKKFEYYPDQNFPNRTKFENKLARIIKRQNVEERKGVPKIINLLSSDDTWDKLEKENNNKEEKNLSMVSQMIKKRYPNIDNENRKTPFKQMAINERREAVDLIMLLNECDRIIEFWTTLSIVEEQLREKQQNEEWKYQRKLNQIKTILLAILNIKEGKNEIKKETNLLQHLEKEKQNLHKMDKLIDGLYLSSFMKEEVKGIKQRINKAEKLLEQSTYILIHVNNNIWGSNEAKLEEETFFTEEKLKEEIEEKNTVKELNKEEIKDNGFLKD